MSRGNQLQISSLFAGSACFFATLYPVTPAQAGDTAYFYCRRIQGNPYSDFALAVTGENITLQPHASPESPGVRIYHGKAVKAYPSGNILVDFDSYSRIQYLAPFPNVLVNPSLFNKGTSGYARVYNGGGVESKDTIMACEVKKIFI
jgi:hypothetical protein